MEVIRMKSRRIVFLRAVLILSVIGLRITSTAQAQPSQSPPTIASMVDRQISSVGKPIAEAAEAMPDDKFNFSAESLNIPGADYKGVRTCALRVRHIAASNYALWSPLTAIGFLKTSSAATVLKT